MRIVFIAGPYIGDGSAEAVEKNIRAAERFQVALANARVGFFCSHNHTEHFQQKAKAPEAFYHELDFRFLTQLADAVLAVPGWEKSAGASREVEWAKANGLPVFFPQSPEDMAEIVAWASGNGAKS